MLPGVSTRVLVVNDPMPPTIEPYIDPPLASSLGTPHIAPRRELFPRQRFLCRLGDSSRPGYGRRCSRLRSQPPKWACRSAAYRIGGPRPLSRPRPAAGRARQRRTYAIAFFTSPAWLTDHGKIPL